MVAVLSLLSLLGVLIVPLAKSNERCGRVYEYVNLFLMALGTSALFSDAILHILPDVSGCQNGLLPRLSHGANLAIWISQGYQSMTLINFLVNP